MKLKKKAMFYCSYQFNIWYAGHSSAHILI